MEDLNTGGGDKGEEGSVMEKLKMIKEFAEGLREESVTIAIRRMSESILTIREKVKPRLSGLVLESAIQTNILKILSLIRTLG